MASTLPPRATGLESYYRSKVDGLQVTLVEKQHDLSRLEAQRNDLNSRVRRLRDELSRLQDPGSHIGEVVKVMGKDKILVKLQPDGKFIVKANAAIDLATLAAGTRVALRNDSYVLHKILPTKVDPLVSLMRVEAVPEATYDMVGGLEKQVKEMKEVIELPIKHPELFESLGISQPKGVIMYGPPGTGKTLLARAVAHHTDCFPSEDTRVMTNRGFLFLDEIMQLIRDEVDFKYASFVPSKKQIVWTGGKLIVKEGWKGDLVNVTQGEEQARWDENADSYGGNDSLSGTEFNSNFVSLRVTENHELYVQQGKVTKAGDTQWASKNQNGRQVKKPYEKSLAGPLVSQDEKLMIRLLACAENGVVPSHSSDLPFASPFGFTTNTQTDAFIELIGFWLGDGSMHYQLPSDKTDKHAVRFTPAKTDDTTFIITKLTEAGLVKNLDYTLNPDSIRISAAPWVNFFDEEYGEKDIHTGTAKNVKRLPSWVNDCLTQNQLRLLIRGLQRADGACTAGLNYIYTSSPDFRDELLLVLFMAGYTATFKMECSPDTEGPAPYSNSNEKAIVATQDHWSVCFSEPTSAQGKLASWPSVSRGDMKKEAYNGTVWCVQVDHSDHLIVAQRAFKVNGVVTKSSRPLVVGNCTFIRVSGSELVQKYIGEGSRMVRELFVMARQHAPSIIFMDEIDSIGGTRIDSSGGGGDSEVQRTMLELLNQLDGFESSTNIKVLMATNRLDILDPALLRPGRIDRKIEFPNPNEAARLQILKIHSRKMNLMRGINLRVIANKMKGASGAESKAVCTEAGMFALRERRVHVTQEDFEMAVSKVLKKDSDKDMSQQQFWK